MKQLLSVVNMMHHQNIAHRNIHPGHIMLIPKRGKFILKLIDFSWSASPEAPKLKIPRSYKLSKAYDSI
jgi:serine/threonine protein kinase